MTKTRVFIVAALFKRRGLGDRLEVALFRRNGDDEASGLWEFPGGKIEAGESPEQAVVREVREELSLDVRVKGFVGQNHLEFSKKILDLRLFEVHALHHGWKLIDHDDSAWVNAENWRAYNVSPLDIPLLEQIFNDET